MISGAIPPPLLTGLAQAGGDLLPLPAPPSWMGSIPAGTVVRGEVIWRDPNTGVGLVRLPQGILELPLPPSLPQGAVLTAQLQPSLGGGLQLAILGIDRNLSTNSPFAGASTALMPGSTTAAAARAAVQAALPAPTAGTWTEVTVVQPQVSAGPAPAPGLAGAAQGGVAPSATGPSATGQPAIPVLTQQAQGAQLPVKILDLQAPGLIPQAIPSLGSGGTAAGLPSNSLLQAQAAAQAESPPISPSALLAGNGAVPGATAAPGTLPGTPVLFQAQVVGAAQTGQPILLAGQSLLTLETTPLLQGTTVILAIAASRASNPPPDSVSAVGPFSGLAQLLSDAGSLGPQVEAAIRAVTPKPGPRFAAEMLNFIGALRSGDLSALLGEEIRTEIRIAGRGKILNALGEELAEAKRAATSTAGEWRTLPIPVLDGQVVQPIRLHLYRPDPEDEGRRAKGGGGGQRFMVDLELSRLGPLQLDGLAREQRLDLILRSPAPMPDALKRGLSALFADIIAAQGLAGDMRFHVAPLVRMAVPEPPGGKGILV